MKKDNISQLKMSLQEIRNSIDLEKVEWTNRWTTNCYAYALGLDIPEEEIIWGAYAPGTISGALVDIGRVNTFSYNTFVTNLYSDLEFLGIDFKKINPNQQIDEDEWKIAVFTSSYFGDLDDYHFLRYRDNVWYHKNGWNDYPTHFDDRDNQIFNPKKCYLDGRVYRFSLSLKLK